MDRQEMEQMIFVNIFLLGSEIQTAGNKNFKEISLKQWFLLHTIFQTELKSPSLTELSNYFGSSRQNVTKMVEVLEKKGYVTTQKLLNDKRYMTVKTTRKTRDFFKDFDIQGNSFLENLFKGVDISMMKTMSSVIGIMQKNLYNMS